MDHATTSMSGTPSHHQRPLVGSGLARELPLRADVLSNSSLVDGGYLKRTMEHHLEQEYHLEMVD